MFFEEGIGIEMKYTAAFASTTYHSDRFIDHSQMGQYFTYAFEMPEDSESLRIRYSYARYDGDPWNFGPFFPQEEINIIDLGLINPSGQQVGASGSDKEEIFVSETRATPGYRPAVLTPGFWEILVGAYKVAPDGVHVSYEIEIKGKNERWLKGDLHAHTVGSDGVHTAEELAWKALRHGLDFVAITDHNQMSATDALPRVDGVTLIPGVEWTHYRGHASFLGVDQPYDGVFAANTDEEIQARFASARERGALIVVDHPFEAGCEFSLDMQTLPFDCLEVWNGPMRESNLRALGLWQQMLMSGKKIPICGGSDYHRDTPFIFLGGPTTHVYAASNGPSDILAALRAGNSYITFAPDGPVLEFTAGDAMMGDTVTLDDEKEMRIHVDRLIAGDILRLVTLEGSEDLLAAKSAGRFECEYEVTSPGFARLEVWRAFLPGIPKLPALLSNPIYFD
jgi:hypothetical protein